MVSSPLDQVTYQAEAAERLFRQPERLKGGRWLGGYSFAWLGLWVGSLTASQYLMPAQIASLKPSDSWQQATLDLGLVAALSAAFTIIAYPVVGALSDRTVSRFGRRRPWIFAGTAVSAISFLLLPLQTTLLGISVLYGTAAAGFCALSSGLTSLIADQVPVRQRGLTSGLIAAPQALGLILGVLVVTVLFTGVHAGYAALAVLLTLLVAPFLIFVRDPALPRQLQPPLDLRSIAMGLWVSPTKYPDFGWVLLSRTLANLANSLCTGLLLYYLLFGLGRATAEQDLLLLTVIYAVTSIGSALTCGRLSDRLGRRRVFVVVSALLQAFGALLLSFDPTFDLTVVSAVFFGLGWGCYQSVDQALATEVLPSAHDRGKDLGILNLASAVPSGIGPLVGAGIVSIFGTFTSLFIAGAVIGVMSALSAVPIRGVR